MPKMHHEKHNRPKNLQHYEIESVGFELFRAVHIGEDENVAGAFHGEVLDQFLLAHGFQSL